MFCSCQARTCHDHNVFRDLHVKQPVENMSLEALLQLPVTDVWAEAELSNVEHCIRSAA